MSAQNIRAGQAFVELTIRDRTVQGLRRAQSRMQAFALTVKAIGNGLKSFAGQLQFIGSQIGILGAGMMSAFGAAAKTFLDVSKQAKEAGKAIAGIDPSKAERLQAAWDRLQAAFGATKFKTGEAIAEPASDAADRLTGVFETLSQWIGKNQKTVQVIAAVGGAAVAVFGAMAALVIGIKLVGGAMAVLAPVIAGLGAALGFLATPIGMVIAALAAVGAAIIAVRMNWEVCMRAMIGATAAMVANVAALLRRMETELGVNLGAASLDKMSKDIRDMAKLFPTTTGKPPAPARKAAQQARAFQGLRPAFGDLSGQRGAFSGVRAENLSIGSGGGKEDRRHREEMKKLDEIVNAIERANKPNDGPRFQ